MEHIDSMSEPDTREVRELRAALERIVDELEEQRVAAIELRMLLDASEARLRTMSAELEEARAQVVEAKAEGEAGRVEAIEMRMILDATEHRAAKLEEDLAATEARQSAGREEESRQSAEFEMLRARCSELEAEVEELRSRCSGLEVELAESRARLEDASREAAELESLRAAAARTEAELEDLRPLVETASRTEAEVAGLHEAAARAAAEVEELRRALDDSRAAVAEVERARAEAAAEGDALRAELAAARAARERSDDELGELRLRAQAGEEVERHRQESERLQSRLDDLERTRAEEAERHAARAREQDALIERLRAELAAARAEREESQRSASEAIPPEGVAAVVEDESLVVRAAAADTAGEAEPQAPLRLAAEPVELAEVADVVAWPAAEEGARRGGRIVIVHIDDRPEYRAALEELAAQLPGMTYHAVDALPAEPLPGPSLVVANLHAANLDTLALIASCETWGLERPEAFTYAGDGVRGLVLGAIEYFPEPFDADTCAMRLLGRPGGIQRLLTVSDDVELMNSIRATMTRLQCSTSVALDSRQAFELATLVRPELVLVDLALPRGEAMRLVARLRADLKTTAIPSALLWSKTMVAADLRAHAARAARDTSLAPEELRRVVSQALADTGVRLQEVRESA